MKMESLYPYLPVWMQNLAISCYGFSYYHERLGGNFHKYCDEFRKREGNSILENETYINQQIQNVLIHSFKEVPYYRKIWKSLNWNEDTLKTINQSNIHTLPILKKKDLRKYPNDFIAHSANRRTMRRYTTSGSSGTPITCFCSSDGRRKFTAAREARSFSWAKTSTLKSRAMIGGRRVVASADAKPPYYRYNFVEKQVYFSAYHLSPKTVENYVEGFNRHHPALLTGYAYSYYLLAKLMIEQKLKLNYQPEALVLSSEKLTEPMREIIQEAFGAPAYGEYGSVENCILATECEHRRLHVHPDFGILEIVDDENQPVPPGVEGRILATGLLNFVQPLIRYEIGDRGVWDSEPCPCGRHLFPVIKEVIGRIEDVVVGADGRQMVRFHGIFIDLPHIREGQVVQESMDCLKINLEVDENFNSNDEKIICDRIRSQLGEINIQIEKVDRIPRGANGKFKPVISKLRSAERG